MRKLVLILLIAVATPRFVHADDASAVKLLVGRSTVVDVGSAIARVSLTSADVVRHPLVQKIIDAYERDQSSGPSDARHA